MKKLISILLLIFIAAKSFATADDVYHEQTSNPIGGSCGVYVNNLLPTSANSVIIGFRIANQGFTNHAKIYYTIDGTDPAGSKGVASGTTMVITASYVCTFSDVNGSFDVVNATIPAYPTGTVIKYIVSAYSNFGLEIFGNGGSATTSSAATIFSYTVVAGVLPIKLTEFSGKKMKDNVQLSWTTDHEINVDHFEAYHSDNGYNFKSIGSVLAKGNSNITTQYVFTDLNPSNGNNFYQLKITDKNGGFYYSNSIKINFDNANEVSIKIIDGDLHVRLSSAKKENYTVLLTNNIGQTLKTWAISNDGSSSTHIIKLSDNLTRNIYHIAVSGSSTRFAQSVFIK